ncbi:hypothetical protein YQE_11413, partial [Dendroctonus ponderosae]
MLMAVHQKKYFPRYLL